MLYARPCTQYFYTSKALFSLENKAFAYFFVFTRIYGMVCWSAKRTWISGMGSPVVTRFAITTRR